MTAQDRFSRRVCLGAAAGSLGWLGCAPLRPAGRTALGGRWSAAPGLGVPRDDFGFTTDGQRLYAIGGMTGPRGNALSSVESFQPGEQRWGRLAPLPVPVSSLRAAFLGGRIIVAGGAQDNLEVSACWALLPGTGRWDGIAPLRTARLGHGLAAMGNALFVAGGLAGGEPIASVERYDPQRDLWLPVAPLPQPRFNLALVAVRGQLWAIGGSGPDRRPVPSVDLYVPEQDRWTAGPRLPQPLSNFGAALRAGRWLHVVWHRRHYAIDALDPQAGWAAATPIPTSRHGLGLEALGDRLYAAGGCSEDPQRDLTTVEVYQAG
jgi:hypothetical protein